MSEMVAVQGMFVSVGRGLWMTCSWRKALRKRVCRDASMESCQ